MDTTIATNNTADTKVLPVSMEVAAGLVAEHCYKDRELYRKILNDPIEAISSIISEQAGQPADIKKALPNCKVHTLENTSKRWHIVLPFEYHGEEVCPDNGIIPEENLDEISGGFLMFASGATAVGLASSSIVVVTTVVSGTVMAVLPTALAGATGYAATGLVGSFLAAGIVAGIAAGVVAGGATLTAGITLAAIGGMDAAGIIDAW